MTMYCVRGTPGIYTNICMYHTYIYMLFEIVLIGSAITNSSTLTAIIRHELVPQLLNAPDTNLYKLRLIIILYCTEVGYATVITYISIPSH